MPEQSTTRDVRRWARVVPAYLIFWILGVGILWWLVIPPMLYVSTRKRLGALKAPRTLIWLGLWLAVVLTITISIGTTNPDRALGAGYAAVVWCSAGLLMALLLNVDADRLYQFTRGAILVGTIQGVVMFIAVAVHPSPLSSLKLPSAGALGSGSLQAWSTANLAFNDYFGSGIVRSSGLMAQASWSSGYALMVLLVLLLARKRLMTRGLRPATWIIAVVANLAGLYLTYSRVSLVLLVSAVGVYGVFVAFRVVFREAGPALATISLVVVGVFLVAFAPWVEVLFAQDSLRPGSSRARFASYAEGIDVATQSGPFGLISGAGAKPYLDELGRGAGSESAYVSLLVRGGIIALILFLVLLLGRLNAAIRNRDGAAVLIVTALAFHVLVADVDVGTLTLIFAVLPLWKLRDPLPSPVQDSGRVAAKRSPVS